jgi:hypothetical protein
VHNFKDMTEQSPQKQEYREDEIDLRKLFQSIGNFFVNIGRGFVKLIIAFRRITFKYKVLLIVAILVGLVAAFGASRVIKPYYRTSMLLNSIYLNNKLVDNGLAKLNLLCQENERTGLAKVLKISPEVAKNIVSFDFEPFVTQSDVVEIELLRQKLEDLKIDKSDVNLVIERIRIQNRNTYQVTVLVNDVDIIENLEAAIVNYFGENPYIANRIRTNKERHQQLINKLTADVAMLDSLKTAYNLNLKLQADQPSSDASNNVFLGESGAVNPVTVYSQGVTLFEQLQGYKRSLELGSDFELVDGFTVFSKPDSPGLIKLSVIMMALFVGLAYGIILLIEINKYLNRIEEHGFED